jgi:hypothetical protein
MEMLNHNKITNEKAVKQQSEDLIKLIKMTYQTL